MPALTTVTVTASPTLLYGSQGSQSSPLTIINNDPTNTVWVGNASNIMVAGTNTIPLAPGDSFTSDGSVSLYAVTSGPVVAVAITPGGNSYSPGTLAISGPVTATISGPVTVNGSVGITGTPSVNIAGTPTIDVAGNVDIVPSAGYIPAGLQAQITSVPTGTNIAAGSSFSSPIESVSQFNSYYLQVSTFTTTQATSGAALSAQIQIEWFIDAAGTMPVALETFWIWSVNNTATALPAYLSGPMQGAYMQVTITNPGSAQVMVTGVANLFGSGSTLASTRAYQAAPSTGQLSLPASLHFVLGGASSGTDGILTSLIGETGFSAGTTYMIPNPLQIGPVDAFAEFTGGTLTTAITLCYLKGLTSNQVSVGTGNAGQILWAGPGTTGVSGNANNIFQPRSPSFWFLSVNTAVTTSTITLFCSPT